MGGTVTSQLTHGILANAGIGLWAIEIVEGCEPRMYADETMLRLLGVGGDLTPEQVYHAWYDHIDPEHYEEVNDTVSRIINGAQAEVQYPWHHPTRGVTYVRCGGVRNRDFTEGIRLEGCHREVTELIHIRKQADRLQSDVDILARTVRTLYPVCFNMNLTKDRFRTVHFYDAKPKTLVPQSGTVEQLIELGIATIPDAEISAEFGRRFSRENLLECYRAGTRRLRLEHPQFDADGFIHWMETVVLLSADENDDIRAVAVARNIDQKIAGEKQLREALEEADSASRAKTRFLMNMSHDMRTPLNAIKGFTEMAARRIDDKARALDALKKASAAEDNLLDLIENILTLSSLDSGAVELKPVRLNLSAFMEEVDAAIRAYIAGRDLNVAVRCDLEKDLVVRADEMYLKEILGNIMNNAVKFTPDGGSISLDVRELERDGNTVTCDFVISDTGCGMKPEFLSRVFEPFLQERQTARTRFEGSGVGMAITKKLVELMGGHIEARSAWREGSVFTVTLSFAIDRENEKEAKPFSMEGLRILLVEDNALNLEIAREILEDEGVSVVCAANGRIAVDTFEASSVGGFDAILMDIMMPVMDGNEAAQAIRALDRPDAKTIPIVALSANAFSWDIEQAKQSGMNAHLAKPIDFTLLKSTLAELIKG